MTMISILLPESARQRENEGKPVIRDIRNDTRIGRVKNIGSRGSGTSYVFLCYHAIYRFVDGSIPATSINKACNYIDLRYNKYRDIKYDIRIRPDSAQAG